MKRITGYSFFLFTLILGTVCSSNAFATTYYVSVIGNDNGDGLSIPHAWRTIQNGINHLNPGDTLDILAGTYVQANHLAIYLQGGMTNAPITIKGQGSSTIIDVSNSTAQGIWIGEPNIILENFVIQKDPHGDNIDIDSNNITISNVTSMYAYARGFNIGTGTTGVVLNQVTADYNCQQNLNGIALTNGTGWANGITIQGTGNTVSNSLVYNNWCEGIGTGYPGPNNPIITGNTVHDNYSVNIYLDHTQNALVQKNYIYNSLTDNTFWRSRNTPAGQLPLTGTPASGIQIADETSPSQNQDAHFNIGDIIRNNIIIHVFTGISYWTSYGYVIGLQQASIWNNTIYEPTYYGMMVQSAQLANGSTIVNNIVNAPLPNSKLMNSDASGFAGLRIQNNLWYANPTTNPSGPSTKIPGLGDVSADSQFVGCVGTPNATCYKVTSTSPALYSGDFNVTIVPDDFGGFTRSKPSSIGAYAYETSYGNNFNNGRRL